VFPPVHFDHFSIQDVTKNLLHRDLTSIPGTPAQSVREVVSCSQRENRHPRDELVLALVKRKETPGFISRNQVIGTAMY